MRKTQFLFPDNEEPEDRERIDDKEPEKTENELANKITHMFEKINTIKTSLLSPNMNSDRKAKLMSQKYPRVAIFISKFFSCLRLRTHSLIPVIDQPKDDKGIERRSPLPEEISFRELAKKNIVFCDNRKRPLYTQEKMIGKHGFIASEEVLAPMILEDIMQAFQEVALKAKSIPAPTSGLFAGTPMDKVMSSITDEHILIFLHNVNSRPLSYIGKNYKVTEAFTDWALKGAPFD